MHKQKSNRIFTLISLLSFCWVFMLLGGCTNLPSEYNVTASSTPPSAPVAIIQPNGALSSSEAARSTAAAFPELSTNSNANTPSSNAAINNINVVANVDTESNPDTAPPLSTEPVQAPGDMENGQYSSLWDVIRAGFTMNHNDNNPTVQTWIQFYTKDPALIQNIATQSIPYLYYIVHQVKARNMPTEIALLPIVESGFQPTGRSWCGALGLWQLMPQTARDLNTGTQNGWFDPRVSVQDSTPAALNYLKYLYNYFNGDWMLALAAYNAGPGNIQNAVNANAARDLPTDFWDLRLNSQTANYVPKLLALAIIINNPSTYGITLPNIPNKPLLGTAAIPQQMSLSQAAKFAGMNEDELKALNPAFTKNVTPPKYLGTYTLNLPISKVSTFEENCAANPGVTGLERYTMATAHSKGYGTYRIEKGETLYTASRFTGVPVSTLKSYNHLRSTVVHPGQIIRYPIDTTAAYTYITYRVKPGDNLSDIANRYHVELFDLMQWNNLSSKSHLYVGERLVIRQKISY